MMPPVPLPASAIEAGLLAAAGTDIEKFIKIGATGLATEDFVVWGEVYAWQRDHLMKYSTLPTAEQIKLKFSEWAPPDGELAYWLAEMKRLATTRKAQIIMREAMLNVERDPGEAVSKAVSDLARLRAAGNQHMSASDENAGHRFDMFERRVAYRKEHGEDFLIGIPTGLETLDDTHIGWVPSEFVGFYARPTVGKTWMLVREGAIAWANGRKVMMVSPEMAVSQIELRIDVFMARAMGVNLSHQAIFTGDEQQREQYRRYTEAVKEIKRWWTFDSWGGKAFSVGDIRSLAEQLEPDLILIDGVSLLRTDSRRDKAGWEKMDENCEALKAIATAADIVIMASHQSVNTRRGQRGERDGGGGRGDDWVMPNLNDAAGGDALVRNCSSIFTMCPDKELSNIRWYSVRKTRERFIKDWKPRMALRWNVDAGQIDDLGKHGDNMGAIRSVL